MKQLDALLQEHERPEQLLYKQGFMHVAGVDEAGRGPLAGPVVAAAVILPPAWGHPGIRDSKKLTPAQRTRLFSLLQEHALAWGWSLCGPEEIDRINILRASLHAMQKALARLQVPPDYIIVDGPHAAASPIPQTPIIRGDAKSMVIAAASIMAKVVRDAIMHKYHALYPQYNFARNKGYGTREHLNALAQHGCCPIHRKSFKKVSFD